MCYYIRGRMRFYFKHAILNVVQIQATGFVALSYIFLLFFLIYTHYIYIHIACFYIRHAVHDCWLDTGKK